MLDYLDNLLRQLFITRVPGITTFAQVRFQPPDDDWRKEVSTLQLPALNVYMVELKENRQMRSVGRTQTESQGIITETLLPRWVDVQYLITAWDPSTPQMALEPTIVEHQLLWGVTVALMDADPIVPRKIYFPNPLPVGFPEVIQDMQLPTTVLPRDGFGKHAEFWGTMPGSYHPWRPSVVLVVTLPVTAPVIATIPMVTTRITEYRASHATGAVEIWVEIGGTVFDATVNPPVVVAGAWVGISDASQVQLATSVTDNNGHFVFNQLRPGNYQLQFRAGNHPAPSPRNITVPSPTGEYNLQFT